LPDFISAAVNGHNEVAVIARLAHGREQERAQKFSEQQAGGAVSIFHDHQAGSSLNFITLLPVHIAWPGRQFKSIIMSPTG
jgi:hypothetical protein